jgi:hypothetical protein
MLRKILQKSYSTEDILLLAFVILYFNASVGAFYSLLGSGYPSSSFLSPPVDGFLIAIDKLQITDAEGYPLMLLGRDKARMHIIILIFFGYTLFLLLRKTWNTRSVIFFTLLSYPVLFSINTVSSTIIVFVLIFFSLTSDVLFARVLTIALAGALNIYSLIFLAPILCTARTMRTAGWVALSVLTCLAAIHAILFLIAPSDISLSYFLTHEILPPPITSIEYSLAYGSSLYMPLAFLFEQLYGTAFVDHPEIITLSFVLAILLLTFLYQRKRGNLKTIYEGLTFEKLLFISCISSVLLPTGGSDAGLLMMLLPLLILREIQYSFGYFLLYGLLLGAKNLVWFGHLDETTGLFISLQVFINPLILSILLLAEVGGIGFLGRGHQESISFRPAKWYAFVPAGALLVGIVILAGHTYDVANRRQLHNREAGLPLDFDPQIYLNLHPGLQEFWISVGMRESGQALLDHAEVHYKYFGAKDGWTYK